MQLRDETCRYPGCTVPAPDTHGHHVRHWLHGGKTELSNLLSLCRFHHHRHHEGQFEIVTDEQGRFVFVGSDGVPIRNAVPLMAPPGSTSGSWKHELETIAQSAGAEGDAAALGGGEACDMDHTMWVLAHQRDLAAARAGPGP